MGDVYQWPRSSKSVQRCFFERKKQHHLHTDHVAEKGFHSWDHCNLVHTLVPMLKKLSKFPQPLARTKNQNSTRRDAHGPFSPKTPIASRTSPNIQRQSCPTRRKCQEVTGGYASFTEQSASASHMMAAKVVDTISRLPKIEREAHDAVSAHTQVKMRDAPKLMELPVKEYSTV